VNCHTSKVLLIGCIPLCEILVKEENFQFDMAALHTHTHTHFVHVVYVCMTEVTNLHRFVADVDIQSCVIN